MQSSSISNILTSGYILLPFVSILFFYFSFLFVLNKSSKSIVFKFCLAFAITLILNVFLFKITNLFMGNFIGTIPEGVESSLICLVIVLTLIFNIDLVLRIKSYLPKIRKSGDLYAESKEEFSESKSKSIGLFIIFILVTMPLLFVVDKNILEVLSSILLSITISFITSVFLFPPLVKKLGKQI